MALTPSVADLAALDPAGHRSHPLHTDSEVWSETNCYTDLWLELLHALGTEALAMGAFSVVTDFEGTQWSFFKPPLEDLRDIYGIEVGEFNVWRPVPDHVEDEAALGRLLTVEVDAWFLPDTAGASYRTEHVKTSIVPLAFDRAARHMTYLHGPGLHAVDGEDFDGLTARPLLPPYVELVRLPSALPDHNELVRRSVAALAGHLSRAPATNPVTRMGERIGVELAALGPGDGERYHLLAFATFRQCGSAAQMAAAYLAWLAAGTGTDLDPAIAAFAELAAEAKAAQFQMARAARGRTVDLGGTLDRMAAAWDRGQAGVAHLAATP